MVAKLTMRYNASQTYAEELTNREEKFQDLVDENIRVNARLNDASKRIVELNELQHNDEAYADADPMPNATTAPNFFIFPETTTTEPEWIRVPAVGNIPGSSIIVHSTEHSKHIRSFYQLRKMTASEIIKECRWTQLYVAGTRDRVHLRPNCQCLTSSFNTLHEIFEEDRAQFADTLVCYHCLNFHVSDVGTPVPNSINSRPF